MSDAAELLTVVDAVIIALRRYAIPYFVTGSFASSIHGEFRATADIDLVADMHPAVLPSRRAFSRHVTHARTTTAELSMLHP
ncbi:MAG: hypothetical protein Q8K82_17720 [Gemmatimonadaceae bacterium]|nr:hypothetical protein [Gemmatimonadaceae bacterium]